MYCSGMNVADLIVLLCIGGQVLAAAALVVVMWGWWGVAADVLAFASLVAAVRLGRWHRNRENARRGW